MRRLRSLWLAVAALAAAVHPLTAHAGQVEVSPTTVVLTRDEKSAVVKLRNRSGEPARFQIALYAWDQSVAGEMKLGPTEEIAAFPRAVTLDPGTERIVRVGTTVPFGKTEKTYRLFIEELPPRATADAPSRVQVLSRISIPVFAAPDGPLVEKAVVEDVRVAGRRVEFTLRNLGNTRVRPVTIQVLAADSQGNALASRPAEAWYVLAGGSREYVVDLPEERCGEVRAVRIEVAFVKDTLRGSAPMPNGTCAR